MSFPSFFSLFHPCIIPFHSAFSKAARVYPAPGITGTREPCSILSIPWLIEPLPSENSQRIFHGEINHEAALSNKNAMSHQISVSKPLIESYD